MAPEHPKHSWKAFSRDLLRSLLVTLGVLVVSGSLCFGFQLMHALGYEQVRQDRARLDIANLQHALERYHETMHRYPTIEEGLQLLVDLGYIERFPLDPWDHPYQYALREGRPVVWSFGADGAPGGEEVDADIVYSFEPHAGRVHEPGGPATVHTD